MARLDNAHKQLLRRALSTWPPSCLAGEDTSIIGRVTKAGRPVRPTRSLPVWQRAARDVQSGQCPDPTRSPAHSFEIVTMVMTATPKVWVGVDHFHPSSYGGWDY